MPNATAAPASTTLAAGNVVVGFVAHLATNRAALLAAVPHPEALHLCQFAYTPAELDRTVESGAAFDIPVHVGTASCDAARGFALPPGNYDVIAVLPQNGPDGVQPSLLSAPAPLKITA